MASLCQFKKAMRIAFTAAVLSAAGAHALEKAPAKPAPLERQGSFIYRDFRLREPVSSPAAADRADMPARRWDMFGGISPRQDERYGPRRDPKFDVDYPGRLQVRVVAGEESPDRRFVIHYLRPEDEPLARRVGSVLARLYWIGFDYLGLGPVGKDYVNVWLARDGQPGAEEFQGHIYLYAIQERRAPAEWIRELAHEYAHRVLPEIGPYMEPEKWANGYLGERLFMKWLLFDNQQSAVWDQPIDGAAYVENQVIPLRNRFLNEGPAAPAAGRTDAAGMEHLIGYVLALEAAHGPRVLKSIFQNMSGSRPQNLSQAYALTLRDLKLPRIPIDPRAYIPSRSRPDGAPAGEEGPRFRRAAYWLYLPGGEWLVELQGTLPESLVATLDGGRAPGGPAAGSRMTLPIRVPTANPMWRRLELGSADGRPFELRRISISRGAPAARAPAAPAAGGECAAPTGVRQAADPAGDLELLNRRVQAFQPAGPEPRVPSFVGLGANIGIRRRILPPRARPPAP